MTKVSLPTDRPRRAEFLPFAPPLIGDEEKREVLDVLSSGWLTKGPKTEQFEKAFADYCGIPHAAAVNSCTAALHLSLLALGVGEGDEVLVPTMTFASTAHAVLYVGAKPVLVDCGDDFNMSVEDLRRKITPRTKAVIPVHYGGYPCDMEAVFALAKKFGFHIVEDAAHAAGASYHGKKIGSLRSNATCFSFYATKNMTTGEGGMVTSWDGELVERVRVLSMYGISDARRIWKRYAPKGNWAYDITDLGYKYNMTDIQAAIGIHQLRRLDAYIRRRSEIARLYREGLAGVEAVELPNWPMEGHAWHLFPILLNLEKLTISRDQFIEKLKEESIGTSVLYIPLHLHTFYRKLLCHPPAHFPVATSIYQRLINLPIAPAMSDEDVMDVIGAVERVAQQAVRARKA